MFPVSHAVDFLYLPNEWINSHTSDLKILQFITLMYIISLAVQSALVQ